MLAPLFQASLSSAPSRATILFFLLIVSHRAFAQRAPGSPDHPWHAPDERKIEEETKRVRSTGFVIDPGKTYSLPELIDLAESHNPETRFAWERARAQAAALGIARSELYPTLTAAALSEIERSEILIGDVFARQTVQDFEINLTLNYTVFDFGARAGRIDAAKAQVLAANFAFNDAHRIVIYEVQRAYYNLLNAIGQEDAARASLANAKAVQQAAEDRLANGLSTLPDVLEARSATAQADYSLQAVLGQEEIARGDLATALGNSANIAVNVQPLDQLTIPDSINETVDQAIDRALGQRPDLMQQVAQIRTANANVKTARAAYYPALTLGIEPAGQYLFGLQQQDSWAHRAGLGGAAALNLRWTVFDGGARKNRVAQAQADVRAAEAQVNASRDAITNQVWAAYSNLNTAFRQRESAIALLQAATQSYQAALESYNYGLRNLLDVTSAQQTLAQARSSDVLARTQVLASFSDLAFRIGDSIQPGRTIP
jgi:outer membrane protein TolC